MSETDREDRRSGDDRRADVTPRSIPWGAIGVIITILICMWRISHEFSEVQTQLKELAEMKDQLKDVQRGQQEARQDGVLKQRDIAELKAANDKVLNFADQQTAFNFAIIRALDKAGFSQSQLPIPQMKKGD